MEYCGIDVHQSYSQVCILDEDGQVMESSHRCQALGSWEVGAGIGTS